MVLWQHAFSGLYMKNQFRKNVTTVFAGNILYLLVTLAIYLVLFRWMEIEVYATFVLVLAVVDGLTEASDLGLNTSLIKTLGKYSSPTRTRFSIAYVFRLKILFLLFVAVLLFSLSGNLIFWSRTSSAPEVSLGLVFALIGVSIIREFYFAILLAKRKYHQYRNARLINRLMVFSVIAVTYMFGSLSVETALWAFLIAAATVSVHSYLEIFSHFYCAINNIPRSVKSDIADTGKWMSVSGFIVLIMTRLDVFYLSHYSLLAELSYYAIIFKLASVILVMVRSFSQVYLPVQVTRIGDSRMATSLSLKLSLVALGGIAVIWLFVDVAVAGIGLITSKNMPDAASNVMVVLTASFLFSLISSPFSQYLIAHEQSKKLVLLNSMQLGIVIVIGYIFTPKYGVYAPVTAIFLNSFIGYIFVLVAVLFRYRDGNLLGNPPGN